MDKSIERILELRDENNLSDTKLAKRIGINHTTVSRWFNGDIKALKLPYIMKIAETFNVSPSWVAGLDVPKEPESELHLNKRKEIEDLLLCCSNETLDKVKEIIIMARRWENK